jgi:hypothetical protein
MRASDLIALGMAYGVPLVRKVAAALLEAIVTDDGTPIGVADIVLTVKRQLFEAQQQPPVPVVETEPEPEPVFVNPGFLAVYDETKENA